MGIGRRGLAVACVALAVLSLAVDPVWAAVGDLFTAAGTGTAGFSGDGGPATAAMLHSPAGIAVGKAGDLFVADRSNHAIRRVDPNGTITTIAGTGGEAGYAGDGGPASAGLLNGPRDVTLRPNGEIFVADAGNHVVRQVAADGKIATLAGTGVAGFSGDGGPATAAQFTDPSGVASQPNGAIVIADTGNHRIRRVDNKGVVSTVSGDGSPGFAGDGHVASAARLDRPEGVAVLANGTIFIADTGNHRIRMIDHASGVISTVAGTGLPGWTGDGGPATAARLKSPGALAIATDGSILVADTGNHAIRRIDPGGTITTLAGVGHPGAASDGTPAMTARLHAPSGIAERVDGTVVFADTVNDRIRGIQARPDAPVLSGVSPTSPGYSTSPLVFGSADPGTTVTVYGDPACAGAPLTSGSATDFAAPGLYVTVTVGSSTTFSATATDAGGRVSTCSSSTVTYVHVRPPAPEPPPPADRTPPAAPRFTEVPSVVGAVRNPAWHFAAAEEGVIFACRLVGEAGTIVKPWHPCGSPWGVDLTGRPDGTYVAEVTATDAAGNTSTSATREYTLDTMPPAAPVFTHVPDSPGGIRTPVWRFTLPKDAHGASCRAVDDGGVTLRGWQPCGSPWTVDLGGQPDGTLRVEVTATDAAGNTSNVATSIYQLATNTPAYAAVPSPPPHRADATERDKPAAMDSDDGRSRVGGRSILRHGTDKATVSTPEVATTGKTPQDKGSPVWPRGPWRWATRVSARVGRLVTAGARFAGEHADETAFPAALVASAIGFLAVQNQIDRRDPKLALAPVSDEPDMEFTMLRPPLEHDPLLPYDHGDVAL